MGKTDERTEDVVAACWSDGRRFRKRNESRLDARSPTRIEVFHRENRNSSWGSRERRRSGKCINSTPLDPSRYWTRKTKEGIILTEYEIFPVRSSQGCVVVLRVHGPLEKCPLFIIDHSISMSTLFYRLDKLDSFVSGYRFTVNGINWMNCDEYWGCIFY